MQEMDFSNWEGDVTPDNIEQVREALGKRMHTRHIAVDKFTLFTKDDLQVGDHVRFTPQQVELHLIFGHEGNWEDKTVMF